MSKTKVSIAIKEQDGVFEISKATLAPATILNLKLNQSKLFLIEEILSLYPQLKGLESFKKDYILPSEVLAMPLSKLLIGYQENSSGNAGNTSLAYRTLKLDQEGNSLIQDFFQNNGVGVKVKKFKVIPKEAILSLNTTKVDLLFQDTKSGKNKKISLDGVSPESLDQLIHTELALNKKPYRIVFEGLNYLSFIQFYLKPINAKLVRLQEEFLNDFLKIKYSEYEVEKLSKGELDKVFSNQVQYFVNFSNERFLVLKHKLTSERRVVFLTNEMRIFKVDKELVSQNCYPLSIHSPKLYSLNSIDYINPLFDLPTDSKINIDMVKDVLTFKYKDMDFDKVVNYFILSNIEDMTGLVLNMYNEVSTPNYFVQDQQNIHRLDTSNLFSCFHIQNKEEFESSFSNKQVLVKRSNLSGVHFEYYDRVKNGKVSIKNNEMNDFLFFELHKSDMSFEREKLASIFLIERMVSELKRQGFSNIKVILEQPTKKVHSTQDGYLDLQISATKGDILYEDFFELKALHNITPTEKAEMIEQADNYIITSTTPSLVSKIVIDKSLSFNRSEFKKVIPLNLVGDILSYELVFAK